MTRIAILCLFVLLLAACGKSDEEKAVEDLFSRKGGLPGALGGGGPGEMPDPSKLWQELGQVELTDDMMQRYVTVLEQVGANDGRPGQALLTAYSFDWQQWAAVSGVIARASMVGARERIESQLEKARAKLAEAPAEQKARHEAMVKSYAQALENLPATTDLDRKNEAVYERWKTRIEAAGRKK